MATFPSNLHYGKKYTDISNSISLHAISILWRLYKRIQNKWKNSYVYETIGVKTGEI